MHVIRAEARRGQKVKELPERREDEEAAHERDFCKRHSPFGTVCKTAASEREWRRSTSKGKKQKEKNIPASRK